MSPGQKTVVRKIAEWPKSNRLKMTHSSRSRSTLQFTVLHVVLIGFAAALLFGLSKLGVLAMVAGIVVIPLFIVAMNTMAGIKREKDAANKVILLISTVMIFLLAVLVIGGFQFLLVGG